MAKKKKPKVKPVVAVDADEDDVVPVPRGKKGKASAADDEDPMKPRARYDVYFGLTLITTLILIGAAALLYYDQEDLKSAANAGFNPPTVTAGALGFRPAAK